jgi:pyruvate/2-oxoglutarate dehydrogenase complex dihydrolipoamide acyltransferase (E2) component
MPEPVVQVEIPANLWDPETTEEASLINWLAPEGGHVEEGDEIAEIMVEKVTMAVTAPAAGTLHIKAETDATVRLGDVIAEIRP